jgi:hypothetical protein
VRPGSRTRSGTGSASTAPTSFYICPKITNGNLYSGNLSTGALTALGTMDDSGLFNDVQNVDAASFDTGDVFWAVYLQSRLATLDIVVAGVDGGRVGAGRCGHLGRARMGASPRRTAPRSSPTTHQPGFYAGTIESCDPLPDGGDGLAITFARGATLGEMLDTLAATGTCDPVFDPVYDPVNRPGILCDFSLYRTAGEFRPDAIFGWDQWPRNTVQLTRQIDGSARANRMRMFAGQGGPPVPEVDDASSIARFGDYWATQYLVGVPSIAGAHTIAVRQLALLRSGQLTFSLSPAAERAPLLFQEYREADTVPLYASNRFRDPILGTRVRVESIPIAIGDDQLERVASMLVSYSPEGGS